MFLIIGTLLFTMLLPMLQEIGKVTTAWELAEMAITFFSSSSFWVLIILSCVTMYILAIVSDANVKSFIAANMGMVSTVEVLFIVSFYSATGSFVLYGWRIMLTAVE